MKNWIKRILGISALEVKITQQEKEIEWLNKYKTTHSNQLFEHKEQLKMLNGLVQVGVDVHQKTDSWAVICLAGKKEYVKFVNLGQVEVAEIQRFMRNFEPRNATIDSPNGMSKKYFFWK